MTDSPESEVAKEDRTSGKIVGQEIAEGTLLANGYEIKLKSPLRTDGTYTEGDSRVLRNDFTWIVRPVGATADMTQYSVQIPSVCSDPDATPAPVNANPTPSPSNGANYNNSVSGALAGEKVIEWHINNSDKVNAREFKLEFSRGYRVGWVKAAVQTTSNNQAWAWVLGPCANVFDTGGQVWLDLDDDGAIDDGEAGIEGVTLTLLEGGTDLPRIGDYDTPTTESTDQYGQFEFVGLLSSAIQGDVVYQVQATGDPVDDLAVTVANPVTVAGGTTNLGFDKFDISGKVFVDPAGLAAEPETAAGLANVQIELRRESDGAVVGQTLTSAAAASLGLFEFVDIAPGEYRLVIPASPADPIAGNINSVVNNDFEFTVQPTQPISVGLGENETGEFECDGIGFNDRQDGSACGAFFGLKAVNKNIDQKLADAEDGVGGASLTTKSYTWWKNTLNSACNKGWTILVDPDIKNDDPPAGYGPNAIYFSDIFDAIRGFAFTQTNTAPGVDPDPPFDNQVTADGSTSAQCVAYDFIRRPLNSLLLDLEAQLFTAQLNRFTPGFGYYPPGCVGDQCEDTDFVDTFLQFAEADLINRRSDPTFSAKASYSTTESARLYNGGGGGGGTGFE